MDEVELEGEEPGSHGLESTVPQLKITTQEFKGPVLKVVVQVLYRTSSVPYVRVQVSRAQLGVACLLVLRLLATRDMWQETVINTCGLGGIFGLEKPLYSRRRCRRKRWHYTPLLWVTPFVKRTQLR